MIRRAQAAYAAFYSSKFVLLGIQLPFFSGWLALRGIAPADIGLITGAALALRLVLGPFVAFWADHQPDDRQALRLVSALFAASALALLLPVDNLAIAAAAIAVIWCFGLLVPLADSAVLRADQRGLLNYGQTRAIGSFAFLATTIIGGETLTRLGIGAAAPIMAAAACVTFLVGLMLPPNPRSHDAEARSSWADARRILSSRLFLTALVAAGLIQGAHAFYYAFSILHWTSLGYSPRVIGALWAVGVVAEIFLLTRMRALSRRFSPALLIAAGGTGAALRWSLTAMDPPLWALFFVQTLHALSFAATYMGMITFVATAVPERLAKTAMTLNSTTGVGALTGLATVAAGFIYANAGAGPAYFLMGAMAAAGAALALLLARIWRGGRLFD